MFPTIPSSKKTALMTVFGRYLCLKKTLHSSIIPSLKSDVVFIECMCTHLNSASSMVRWFIMFSSIPQIQMLKHRPLDLEWILSFFHNSRMEMGRGDFRQASRRFVLLKICQRVKYSAQIYWSCLPLKYGTVLFTVPFIMKTLLIFKFYLFRNNDAVLNMKFIW